MKITHFIKIFLSSFFMYKLLLNIFKDKKVSLIGTIFYITMPYYILDIYRRDAYAESFVFIFLPIILLCLYNLFIGNKKSFYSEFIIRYVGIVNSHLKTNGVVKIKYTGTYLYKISVIISIITLILLCILKYKNKQKA